MTSLVALVRQIRNSRLAAFALAYASTAAFQKGVGFVVFLWVARTLSLAEYAVFGLLYALQTALTSFASAGIVESAIGLLRDYPGTAQRTRLFGAANSAFAVLAVGAVAFGVVISLTFLQEVSGRLVNLSAVIVAGLAAAYVAIQSSLVRLEERHGAALALGFFVPMGAIAGGAVGLLLGGGVTGFYAGSAFGSVACLLPFIFARIGYHHLLRERAEVVRLLRVLAPFILIAMLAWVGGYGNTYLVEVFFDAQQVASFAFVYSVSSIMQLVATALNQVWSPRFYRLVHTTAGPEVERRNRRFTILQGVALGVSGAVVLLLFTPALDLAGGNLIRYRDLRVELFFLFTAYALAIPWWHAQNYYYAHNKGSVLMRVSLVSSAIGLVLWIGAALTLGKLGAFAGFMLQMGVRSLFSLAWARREWRVRISWEGPAIAVVCMLCGLLGADWLFG